MTIAWLKQPLLVSSFLLLGLIACKPTYKQTTMTPQETQRVQAMTENMTTRCLGRYVMDFPKDFVLNSESSMTIKGVRINVRPMSKHLFDMGFNSYKKKLEITKIPGETYSTLDSIYPLQDKSTGGIFDRVSDGGMIRSDRTLELKAWKDGFEIYAYVKAVNGLFPELANDPYWSSRGNDVPKMLSLLNTILERTRGRLDTEIPAEPGLCFANGFVKGLPSIEDKDSMQLAYQLKDTRDVYFNIQSLTTVREENTMLDRSAKIESGMKESDTQTIRKGKRLINTINAEEWLMQGPTPDRVKGNLFQLRANETASAVEDPYFDVKFHNGFRIPHPDTVNMTEDQKDRLGINEPLVKASLSEAEAIAMWDAISKTLRPRPSAL
jgi:hypothetical protein